MTTVEDFAKNVKYEFELMNSGCRLGNEHYELAVKRALERHIQILPPEDDDTTLLFSDEYSSVWIKEYASALALEMFARKPIHNAAASKEMIDRAKAEKEKLESDLKRRNGVGSVVIRG